MNAPIPLRRNILVLKHGALGDFVLALGPMMAIRAHHLADRVVLLTTAPFADFAAASGLFDEIWIDSRPRLSRPGAWLRLIRRLRGGGFHRVYDLQTSDRSSLYYRFFAQPRPEWSGIARGASHRHVNPDRVRMHTVERQAEQLGVAGISHVPATDLGWATADITRFPLSQPYALLAPGGSAHRPGKRWPAQNFGELAAMLVADGIQPVVVGAAADRAAAAPAAAAGALDLIGRTSLMELVAVARGATVAIGNDTGPMHIAAAAGRRSLVLFSHDSDPSLCAPRGDVRILRRDDLRALPVAEVAAVVGAGNPAVRGGSR